jgi:hypothetical protein
MIPDARACSLPGPIPPGPTSPTGHIERTPEPWEEPASGTTTAALAFALADQQLLTPDRSELQVEMGTEMGRPSRLWARAEFTGQRAVLVRLRGMAERVLTGRLARRPPSAAPA